MQNYYTLKVFKKLTSITYNIKQDIIYTTVLLIHNRYKQTKAVYEIGHPIGFPLPANFFVLPERVPVGEGCKYGACDMGISMYRAGMDRYMDVQVLQTSALSCS